MKLQPNFSWQKYQGEEETQRNQFQYQLQQQHIVVANAVNSTIDDLSYFTRERATSEAWIDGRQIWKKSFSGVLVAPNANATNHGITGINTVVRIYGSAQDATPLTTEAIPLEHTENTSANSLWLAVTPTQYNIVAANSMFNGYQYWLTIEYTKVKNA